MGAAARGWLTPAQRGKVLAVVSHAAYLLTGEEELIWLVGAESPLHRRCVQLPGQLPSLAVDSAFSANGQSITLESGTKLDFRFSPTWEVPVPPTSEIIKLENLPPIFFSVVGSILSQESPVGMGLFLRPVVQIAKKQVPITDFLQDDFLTQAAWPIVERVARACLSHDLPGILKQAEALIGLGDGLTPSGDDFLGGLFFARHLLSRYYPHLLFLELSNLPAWVDARRQETNPISFALLRDNASGHALDPLHRFGIDLLTNHWTAGTSPAAELVNVGHSTGWNLLTGFLVGMLLVFQDQLSTPLI